MAVEGGVDKRPIAACVANWTVAKCPSMASTHTLARRV